MITVMHAYLWNEPQLFLDEEQTQQQTIAVERNDKKVICKNFSSFTDCMTEMNNRQVDNAKDLDFIMPMYDSVLYSNDYPKITRNLWQYCRYETDERNRFLVISIQTEIYKQYYWCGSRCAIKLLDNFWRTLDMPLINCEINLTLTS